MVLSDREFDIVAISREIEIPLTFEQESLWFLDQLSPGTATYNIPIRVRLLGEIDADVLRRSLNEVVRRHEILRTCFQTIGGRPIQVIGAPPNVSLPLVDLTDLPEQERERQAERLCQEQAERAFMLDRDLMLRAALYRLEKEKYILLLNLHHIAADAWSMDILFRELGTLYRAFVTGQPSPLQELPFQYADFAAWQRGRLSGEMLEGQLAYWKRQLAGAPPMLAVPTEWPRPAVQTFRGSVETAEVPASLANALKALSQRQGVSLYMTLLAAFQTLLYRYSGQDNITVGSPIANRDKATGLEELIGLFVNTLPLRIDLSGNPTFRQVLSRTREVVLGAYENQDVPFELLVTNLRPERDLSYNPLFQVLFAVEHAQRGPVNLEVQTELMSSATAKFDLSLCMRDFPGGMSAELEYCTDLFGRETIRRMLDHFMVLLRGIVENPDEHLNTLPLLTADERLQLLVECNQTKVEYGRGRYLDELIEEQSRATPDRIAVKFGDDLLTYRELAERAEQVARNLRQLGVGPDDLVGVYVERSLDMAVGLLGILKTGGAYLPLDPVHPTDRLAFMLKDAGPISILTQKRLEATLPDIKTRLIFLDDLQLCYAQQPEVRPGRERRPSDLAYVIYTSGSTGTPKGVQITHRSVVNFLNSMREKPGLTENDALLAVTTLSFDIAALELFLPLTAGGVVVIASGQAAADPKQLVSLLEHHQITVMQATPATWQLLLEANWTGSPRLKILCGGEAWSSQLARQLLSRCCSLWNMYGPTEATIWASVRRIEQDEGVLIGPPIANSSFYVLQKDLQPAPTLVPGELYIGGDCVARGYLNRPDLSEEKFIVNPFSHDPTNRLYRTGDLVRRRSDGALEFLGRSDNQVKIRGFRIELDEIATVLRQHSAIKDVVVVVQQEGEFDRRLVAYIIVDADQMPDASELQEFLKRQLPIYMVPSKFKFVERFPLTQTGKIDRKALKEITALRPDETKFFVAPRTLTELAVAEVWKSTLGVENVGARDDFFELGGHSLMIVRAIYQINHSCKVRIGVPDLFRNPTVEQLANVIDSQQLEGRRQPAVVQLQERGAQTPLYFIYAGPDEFHLARLMGARRPVFGIQIPWPVKWRRAVENNEVSSFPDMDQFVAPFVKALSAHVGSSPCMLAGHSFAGLVAFEAARQLRMQGAKVDTVIIVDKWAKYPDLPQVARQNLRLCWSEKAADPRQGRAKSIMDRCRRSALIIWWPLKLITNAVLASLNNSPGQLTTTFDEDGAPLPWNLLARLYSRIESNYRPRPLDCRGIIFRTDFMDLNHSVRVLDEYLGWGHLFTRGSVNFSLSGDHISIFREHNQSLAMMINKVLEQPGFNDSREKASGTQR